MAMDPENRTDTTRNDRREVVFDPVTKIDQKTRVVTLETDNGQEYGFACPRAVSAEIFGAFITKLTGLP